MTGRSPPGSAGGWPCGPPAMLRTGRGTRARTTTSPRAPPRPGDGTTGRAPGAFHDNAAGRVSLVTTGSLGTWDRRRFRANVVLEGTGEGGLVGSQVRIGGVVLDIGDPIQRCVMVTRPQPGGIARDTSVLKTIHRERDGDPAVAAPVRRSGSARTGDLLEPA